MAGWRTLLVVQGYGPGGESVPVAIGLVESSAGEVQIGLRLGEKGPTVILPLQSANQLGVRLCEAVAERLKITAERLGGDEP